MLLKHVRDVEIIDLLRKYGPLTQDQLIRYFGDETTKHRLKALIRDKEIRENGGFLDITGARKGYGELKHKAFELLIKFKDSIQMHEASDYPFDLVYIRNNNVYDVAVIERGQEMIQAQLINRSQAKRIVLIVENEKQAQIVRECLNTDANIVFLIVEGSNVEMLEEVGVE